MLPSCFDMVSLKFSPIINPANETVVNATVLYHGPIDSIVQESENHSDAERWYQHPKKVFDELVTESKS